MFNFKRKSIDFLAIGDITTDAFIRLEEASINCNVDKTKCELCMRFGDKIPYEFVEIVRAVGNSPNAAVSAARLGLNSAILTSVGDDQNGKECIETLNKDNVNTKYITIDKKLPTNYHYVLWYGADRTILVKHAEFTYKLPKDMPVPKWIYLSSLADNSLPYHLEIADYLKSHPEVNLTFQPGTFQIKLGTEVLKDIYKHTKVFVCNLQEYQTILNSSETDPVKLMTLMRELGPQITVLTDGPNGAFTYDGKEAWSMPLYPDPKPPYSRTGAGDAYASTFTSCLLLGKSIPDALKYAPINSMSVVQQIGAQKGLLTIPQIEKYLKEAPENYKPNKII